MFDYLTSIVTRGIGFGIKIIRTLPDCVLAVMGNRDAERRANMRVDQALADLQELALAGTGLWRELLIKSGGLLDRVYAFPGKVHDFVRCYGYFVEASFEAGPVHGALSLLPVVIFGKLCAGFALAFWFAPLTTLAFAGIAALSLWFVKRMAEEAVRSLEDLMLRAAAQMPAA